MAGSVNSQHFNRLDQYAISPANRTYFCVELAVSFPAVAETIASTYCTYPWMDGQAELDWMTGYIPGWYACLKTVVHPSTN